MDMFGAIAVFHQDDEEVAAWQGQFEQTEPETEDDEAPGHAA